MAHQTIYLEKYTDFFCRFLCLTDFIRLPIHFLYSDTDSVFWLRSQETWSIHAKLEPRFFGYCGIVGLFSVSEVDALAAGRCFDGIATLIFDIIINYFIFLSMG